MISLKRESFRVDIRRKQLEETFDMRRQKYGDSGTDLELSGKIIQENCKRICTIAETMEWIKNTINEQFEINLDYSIKLLLNIIKVGDLEIKLYIINCNLLSQLTLNLQNYSDLPELIESGIILVDQLFREKKIIKRIVKNDHLRAQLIQYLNYITSQINYINRQFYWELLKNLQMNATRYFHIQKNIFALNCEELILNKEEIQIYQIQLLVNVAQQFRTQIKGDLLPLLLKEKHSSTALHSLNWILQSDAPDIAVCCKILEIFKLLLNNVRNVQQQELIINYTLIHSIKINLYRHQNTQLQCLYLIESILKTPLAYLINDTPSILEILLKFIELSSVQIKIEILKLFYLILTGDKYPPLGIYLIENNLLKNLFTLLQSDISLEIIIISLKCAYRIFKKLGVTQLKRLFYETSQLQYVLEKLSQHNNEEIRKLSEVIIQKFLLLE